MYMFVFYIRMCIRTCLCAYYVGICECVHIAHICISAYTHRWRCLYVNMLTGIYEYVYTYIYIYTCVYIDMQPARI